jgi:eukaryotic-like serine/threonine-protein kinase
VTKADGGHEAVERVGGYRVVRRLATGGTSDVLLARAEGPLGFERNVVLKLLLSQFRSDDEFARMFAREASAYARLAHPSIVRLFDFFALPPSPNGPGSAPRDGQLVMVLEHVDGPALSRFRSQLKAVGKELDDRTAIYIAARVFDALAAAHATVDESGNAAPVIHRDVNPSNILLPFDGQVKLADFGVAKVTGLEHQSVAGMIKGTYGYMAPEQVTGEMVTPRADVYAGGIVLWELLVKRRAFQRGALPEIEALRAMAEPRLVSIDTLRPDVDKAVRDALKRALEPRADRRTITAEEMVSVLSAIVRPDEGREQLVAALQLVRSAAPPSEIDANQSRPTATAANEPRRHDPHARANEAPITVPHPEVAVPPPPRSSKPRGMLPKGGSRPPSISRMKAAYGSPNESAKPTRPTMQKVAPPPPPPSPGPPPSPRSLRATLPLGSSGTLKLPSTPKLFAATLSTKDGHGPGADRAGADARPPAPPSASPAPPRTTSSARRLAANARIDEVLHAMPSSMPPSILDEAPANAPRVEVIPPMGAIPSRAAPAPIARAEAGSNPVEEDDGPDTLVMNPADVTPLTPRMVPLGQTTQMMPAVSTDEAQHHRPAPPPSAQDVRSGSRTGAMPPVAQAYAPPAPPSSPEQTIPPSPGTRAPSSDRDTVPSRTRKGISVGVIAAIVMLLIGAGTAGSIGYLRYKRARTTRTLTSMPATATATSAAVTVTVPVASATSVISAGGASRMEPPPSATPSAIASETPPTASARGSESAAAKSALSSTPPASDDFAEGMGVVKTTGAAPGRRIFVDEKTLGQTPETVTVKCGKHVVRLGSSGKSQTIDVPCGGEITVADKF